MTKQSTQVESDVMCVAKTLKSAWAAVEAAEIPEPLHAVAFSQAVLILSASRDAEVSILGASGRSALRDETARDRAVAANTAGSESSDTALLAADEDAFFATLANESNVDEEKLRKVYFVKDGRPRIAVTKSKLGSTEAERNRAVATLLAGTRWYVEGRASVLIGEIRTAAEAIPYEVSRNLATQLDGVAGTIAVGVKRDKAIRVQSGRFDEPFSALINKLVSS